MFQLLNEQNKINFRRQGMLYCIKTRGLIGEAAASSASPGSACDHGCLQMIGVIVEPDSVHSDFGAL